MSNPATGTVREYASPGQDDSLLETPIPAVVAGSEGTPGKTAGHVTRDTNTVGPPIRTVSDGAHHTLHR